MAKKKEKSVKSTEELSKEFFARETEEYAKRVKPVVIAPADETEDKESEETGETTENEETEETKGE